MTFSTVIPLVACDSEEERSDLVFGTYISLFDF